MFGKLFGRKSGSVSDSGLPTASPAPLPEVHVQEFPGGTAQSVTFTSGGQVDISALIATVKEAKEHAHGDPMALMAELQEKLGGTQGGMFAVNGLGASDTVGQLERLAKLHADGALTDAEFAAEKAKLIGTPPDAA
jgi:hypothetical protein